MLRKSLSLDPYIQLNIHELPQARTTLSKYPQRGGRYESKEMLPDLDIKFHQTLLTIARTHDSRGRNEISFENLWNTVCKNLEDKGNATEHSYWKMASIIKNLGDLEDLDQKWIESWLSASNSDETPEITKRDRIDLHENYDKQKRDWKPKVKFQVDSILEIAIAYLIEAKNARDAGEESRALHALIECWYYIGMTSSPKTDAEAKSEAGAKQGKTHRDKIANIATGILQEIEVNKEMTDQSVLLGNVSQMIEKKSEYADALKAYDKQVSSGKKTSHSLGDRLTGTLIKWINDKRQTYPDLTEAYNQAHTRAQKTQAEAQRKGKSKPIASYWSALTAILLETSPHCIAMVHCNFSGDFRCLSSISTASPQALPRATSPISKSSSA